MENIIVLENNKLEEIDQNLQIEIFENKQTFTTNDGLKIIELFLSQQNTDNTRRAYRNSIFEFYRFLYGDCGYLTFAMMVVNPCHAVAYQNNLLKLVEDGYMKMATYNARVRGVRQFYEWLIFHTTSNTKNAKLFNVNPFIEIKQKVEVDTEGSEPLEYDEVELMLNNPYTKNEHLQERNALILELAIATGIRNTALLTMTLDNIIDIEDSKVACVQDKGGKTAKMRINRYYDRLMKWYEEDRALRGGDDNGTIFNLHPHSANRIIREWAKSVGIKKKITFHSLRTTTAVEIYKLTDGNLYRVQMALHHGDSKVSKRYVDKADEIIYDAENIFNVKETISEFDNMINEMNKEELVKALLSLGNDDKLNLIKKIRREA